MGWLFGKKKETKVPFPEGRSLDERSLRFPPAARERMIEPEHIKAAAGIGKEEYSQEPEEKEETMLPEVPPFPGKSSLAPPRVHSAPVYIKVDIYQKILGEMDSMRSDVMKLQECNTHLQNSEYNEESNFARLRRVMRGMHDDLLKADRVVFKG